MRKAGASLAIFLIASIPVTALADHNPAGKRLRFEECTYSDGEEALMMDANGWCTYDEDGHILDHPRRFGEGFMGGGTDIGGIFGLMIFLGLLWSAIPAFMAASIAESRGQSKGAAATIGFFGGWLGLAYVHLAMKEGPIMGTSTTAAERKPEADQPTATRLRELDALKHQGLITAEEYDNQRKAILADI